MFYFIERLILLLIVISAIRSAIRFIQGVGSRLSAETRTRVNRSPDGATATMLRQDPVCGTYVAIDTSLKKIVEGKVIHFCSPECRDKYRA
jgi:YHS domain-containing protein